jgi:hypothetical protein
VIGAFLRGAFEGTYHWAIQSGHVKMADDPEFDEPTAPRLYQTLSVVYYVWTAVTVFAVLLDIGNGLDNFLHAPIGIKDNPPEPGPLVALAQALILPLGIGYIALRILRWISKEMGAAFVAGTIACVVLVSVTASALLGKSQWHYEFIPGSVYLFDKVSTAFGYLVLTGFVAADGFFGWNCILRLIKDKTLRTFRWFMVTAGFVLSTILFAIGLCLHFFVAKDNVAPSLALYGILIGIVGLMFSPKEAAKKGA